MNKFFSKPSFEEWLKEAPLEIKDWFQKEIEYLQNNIRPNSKILDVGCGFGRHIKILAPFSKEVIGIDVLNGYQQSLKTSNENGNLIIQDLKVRDYPLMLKIRK